MGELSRIGVAIDTDLLEKFDRLIEQRGYTNRSEAFRDLIRDELVEKNWEDKTHIWNPYHLQTILLIREGESLNGEIIGLRVAGTPNA